MLRILILDDDWFRHHLFRRQFREEISVHCSSFNAFVLELQAGEGSWDLIHLDHDLGDQTSADTFTDGFGSIRAFDGGHAVSVILALNKKPPRVIVHSHNNIAAPRMVSDLRRAGIESRWEPFGEIEL